MAALPNLRGTSSIKLDTLIGLRWIAIGGQTAAILLVGVILSFPMPVGICFALTAASAWLNLFLKLRFPSSLLLSDNAATLLLAYDALQLAGLLYLTGGLENPFSLLLLVPVLVSATAQPLRYTLALAAFTVALTSLLWAFHQPLPWLENEAINMPTLYVAAVWMANLAAMIFAGAYAFRVSNEARKLSTALAATELVLEREHHLSALDGLAAAAAHELGTPLATIAVVAKEMQKELPAGSPLAEDIGLLVSQSERCREILGRLTSLSAQQDWSRSQQPLTHLLAEAADPYDLFDKKVRIGVATQVGAEPIGQHNPAILYGIGNLIENAVDFAKTTIDITASWTGTTVTVEIADDGPGFAPDIIDRIGEPYVTTRSEPAAADQPDHEAGGLGLGFFIAKTFLERSGARLKLANRILPATGAVVTIIWPRSAYEAQRPPIAGAAVGAGSGADYMQAKHATALPMNG